MTCKKCGNFGIDIDSCPDPECPIVITEHVYKKPLKFWQLSKGQKVYVILCLLLILVAMLRDWLK